MMFHTGARKPETSGRSNYSLSGRDERRLGVRSRRRALEGNPRAHQDYHACASAGDGVRVLRHRICQKRGLLSVTIGFTVTTTYFCI